jgi:hypothetical protein
MSARAEHFDPPRRARPHPPGHIAAIPLIAALLLALLSPLFPGRAVTIDAVAILPEGRRLHTRVSFTPSLP